MVYNDFSVRERYLKVLKQTSYLKKYIFLPAGGYWYNTGHYNVESEGSYWSATWLSTSGQDACLFYICSDSKPRPVGFTSHSCSNGDSVRVSTSRRFLGRSNS